MPNVAVRIEYQAAEGPSWLGFTVSDGPGSTVAEACAYQADKLNSSLTNGKAITLNDGAAGTIRVIPAHSVFQILVQPAGTA